MHARLDATHSFMSRAGAWRARMRLALCILAASLLAHATAKHSLSVVLPGTGLNNQRQALMQGLMLASILNWTLVLPVHFQSNKHMAIPMRIDGIFDLNRLREIAPITLANVAKGWPGILINHLCCDVRLEDLLRFRAAMENQTRLFLLPAMSQVSFYSPALDARVETAVMRSIQTKFASCAESLVGEHQLVNALHFRGGDRQPLPLLNCEACNMTSSFTGLGYLTCIREDGVAAGWADAVSCAISRGEIRTGESIYIATNLNSTSFHKPLRSTHNWRGQDDSGYHELLSLLSTHNFKVLTWADVVGSAKACPGIDLHNGYMVSVVEQHICGVVPGSFLPHFPSSWDEYALSLRYRRSRHHGPAAAQLKLLDEMFRRGIQTRRDAPNASTALNSAALALMENKFREVDLKIGCPRCHDWV